MAAPPDNRMSDNACLCAALVVGTYSHGVLQQQRWYVASCISITLHMQAHGKAGILWVRCVSVAHKHLQLRLCYTQAGCSAHLYVIRKQGHVQNA